MMLIPQETNVVSVDCNQLWL